ncbi:MAG TPA: Rossmann-like and DUF2520 domain-containing protein [Actinomycetota bacterium]|nr:Rossmann-like and DUF2520 domain-containing protein [Actinomycetota bacterium]
MNVGVIGAGTVGTAVAVLLRQAGHQLVGVSGRAETPDRATRYLPGVPVREPADVAAAAELVVIGTPDDAIEPTVAELATAGALAPGAWVLHLSGSLGLDALRATVGVGAHRLALHPLQTFPDVGAALEGLPGCWIAVTADDAEGARVGARLVEDLHGVPFDLADELRPLYHAAAVFASNSLVTVSAIAESLFQASGVPDPGAAMAPLQRATLDHVEQLGPARALTGPAIRGDAGTVRRNLEALERHAPELVPVYVALARSTLQLAERSGRASPASRGAVEDVLARWT